MKYSLYITESDMYIIMIFKICMMQIVLIQGCKAPLGSSGYEMFNEICEEEWPLKTSKKFVSGFSTVFWDLFGFGSTIACRVNLFKSHR